MYDEVRISEKVCVGNKALFGESWSSPGVGALCQHWFLLVMGEFTKKILRWSSLVYDGVLVDYNTNLLESKLEQRKVNWK